MTATVSPVRLMSPAAMRFGVWRSLSAKRADGALVSPASADVPEGCAADCRVEWHLARRVPVPPAVLLRWWLMASVLGLLGAFASVSSGAASAHTLDIVSGLVCASLAGRLALWAYSRHAQDHDHIAMSASRVHVACSRGGRTQSLDVHPRWVRVEPVQHDRSLICLSGEGQRVVVGEFVPTESRRQLAEELRWALRHLDD